MSRRVVPTVAALLATASLAAAPAARAAQAPARSATQQQLQRAQTFVPALGVDLTTRNVTRLSHRDLVVVDGELATKSQVRRLKKRGAVVLSYLSVGSVESWREWFPRLRDFQLEALGDWEGERFANVADPGARDVLADQIAPDLLDKGFDGLFLDWVSMVEDHPAQQAGMLDLVSRLSARVHGGGGVLMAQNGDGIIDPFIPLLDAWNREDPTLTYDFESEQYVRTDREGRVLARATMRRLRAAGLFVTATDYAKSPTNREAKRAARIACDAGAVPFVGDILLRKVPSKPPRCKAR